MNSVFTTDRKGPMADATRFRTETAEIAQQAGWRVTPQADIDQFTRGEVTIEAVYSAKDFIRYIVKDDTNSHLVIPYRTVAKIDLLRLWLTGKRSNVIHPSVKREAGVDW
jgi:hypothetical protein